MNLIGWLGAAMLALCGAPAAYKAYMDKHAEGVSGPFIALWLGGEMLTLVYVAPSLNWPLIANYGVNIVFVGIIAYYKWRHLLEMKMPHTYPTLEMEEFVYDHLAKAQWYHSIEGLDCAVLNFENEDFAPGLWAGMEGYKFASGGVIYVITRIDLDNRVLHVKEKK